ncbi:MAG: hypothetical protein ABJC66_16840 [Gammaproteobacteria bacterium]
MNALPPTVVPVLATPFGVVPVANAAQLNPILAELFAARMRGDAAGRQRNPLCYRSADDLLEWQEEPVRQLAAGLVGGIYTVVEAVNNFTDEQLESLKLQARAWFTAVQPNGSVPATNYPLTAWCAVYCVAAPPPSATRSDDGLLRLYESRLGTMFADATNASMRLPFMPGHYGWRPVPGQMAVFPASVTHEIALLRSAAAPADATDPLLLVTVRARFVGPGQTGMPRW